MSERLAKRSSKGTGWTGTVRTKKMRKSWHNAPQPPAVQNKAIQGYIGT